MSESLDSSDWSNERGQKWVANLQALEGMLEPVNGPLISALDVAGATRIADIGCGGGDTLRAIGDQVTGVTRLHGIDVSPDVIEAARRATTNTAISYHCLDAGIATPPEGRCDRLNSRFGVMFFADAEAAFRNLAQWLTPDGSFAFAVWAPLVDNPWMNIARQTVGQFVELPKPEPDAPGPFRYADAERFMELLAACGFRDLSVTTWTGNLAVGGGVSAEAAAGFSMTAFSIGDLVGEDPSLEDRVKQALATEFRAHEVDSVVTLPAQVNIVTGRGSGG